MSDEATAGRAQAGSVEARWPVIAAVLVVMALTVLRPAEMRVAPRWVLPAVEVVLLDLELPDIDGLTVCQQLDENPATVAIPKIILSGRDGGDIVRRARAAG